VFDVMAEVLDRVKETIGESRMAVSYVQGDASSALPFEDSVFTSINVSSVVHECYSYGGGFEGIDKLAAECARVMRSGGVLIYRDPEGVKLDEMVEMQLNSKLAVGFLSFFAAKFFDTSFSRIKKKPNNGYSENLKVYADGKEVAFEELAQGGTALFHADQLLLKGPAGFMHELQRHFLVYIKEVAPSSYQGGEMDCTRTLAGELNSLTPVDSTDITFLDDLVRFLTSHGIYHLVSGNTIYMTPGALNLCFDQIEALPSYKPETVGISELMRRSLAWAQKDGEEHYYYGTAEDTIARLAEASLTRDGSSILGYSCLCPVSPGATRVVVRQSYESFARSHLSRSDRTVSEEKRHIHFSKLPVEEAFPVLIALYERSKNPQLLSALIRVKELLSEYLRREGLPELDLLKTL